MSNCYQPEICRNDSKRGCIVCDDDAAYDMDREEPTAYEQKAEDE